MRNLLHLMQRSKTCIHGFAVDRRIIYQLAFTGTLLVLLSVKGSTQTYTPVTLTGFTADVIADGASFTPGTTVTADVDGSGYYFLNQSFTAFGTPTYYLPNSGLISSVATTGLNFQLASATGNNSLRLAQQGASGALTLATPQSAATLYVLATSGGGPSTADITVKFTDSTSQLFSGQGISDWYDGSGYAIQGIGRVNSNSLALDNGGGSTNPRLYQLALVLSGSNYNKPIAYISFTQTNATGTGNPQVMAITIAAACTSPASQPTTLAFSGVTASQVNGSFTAATGSPTGYLVVRYPNGASPVSPANGTVYTAGNALGTGTVLTAGAATTFTATGLSQSTSYTFYVYAYNNTNCGGPVYNIVTPLTGTQATTGCAGPGGLITVGPSGTYATLTAALAGVSSDMSGAVILELQSNYTSASETYPITLSNSACITRTNTLTIRPATGANGLVITGSNAGPTIDLAGAGYVTIDGRPGGVGTAITVTTAGSTNATNLNIINTNTAGAAIRLDNQAAHNSIKYCDLQGQNTAAANVPSSLTGVVYFGNNGANGNDSNTVDHCNIHSAGSGTTTPSVAIYSLGYDNQASTAAYVAQFNDYDSITNNNIYDFYAASNSAGIEANYGNTSWNISGNSFFQTSSISHTGYNRAIWLIPYRGNYGGEIGNGFTIAGNYIGGSLPACGGTPYTFSTGSTGYFEGIRLELADAATPQTATSVQGNTITNISITTSTSSDAMHGITVTSGNGNVNVGTLTGNIIGTTTGTSGAASGGITIAASGAVPTHMILLGGTATIAVKNNIIGNVLLTAAGSYFSGIFSNTAITGNFSNNTITNITASSTGTTSGRYINGIQVGSGSPVLTITGNTISGLSCNYLFSGATLSQVVGINIASTTAVITGGITGNTVKNLYNASLSTTTGASSPVIGICMGSTNANGCTVSQNIIDSLISGATSGVANVIGLYYSGTSSVSSVISKNFIHSLSGANSAAVLTGIYVNGGTASYVNNMIRLGINADGTSLATAATISGITGNTTAANSFYHNSIYIGGTGVGTTATNTFAFYRTATSGTYDIRNNIFANVRSNATTGGKHYAAYFTTSNTGAAVNYNVYQYSSVFAYSGTADVASYATGWVSSDVNSLAGNPQFINPAGTATTVNLHINSSIATPVEATGVLIAAVTDDYDAQTRSGLTPVDIGADAGNFIAYATCTAPNTPTALTLTASPLQINGSFTAPAGGATGYLVVKYATGASITAPSNAFSYAIGAALGTGTVVAVTTTASFSSTGLLPSTSYTYYVYAYNNGSCTGGPVYSGGLSGTQATTACSSGAGGLITVGATGTYPTITAALSGLSGGIGSPVILELQSAYTSSSEVFPITFSNNACITNTNKITIRPATGANGLVITASNAGPAIDFSGSNYVTIDGRPGGIGTAITATTAGTTNAINLNIINTNAAGAAIRLDNQASHNTIRYCDLQGQNTTAANVPSTLAGVVYFGNNGANGNDSNTVDHCNIHSSGSGTTTPSIGIYSLGYDNQGSTAAYIAQFNDNDTITNNNIYDFYSAANSAGVEANYGNTGWNISGNSFFQTSAITVSSSATSYNRAIWLIPYRGNYTGEVGNGFAITGNYIGGSLPACGGTPYTFNSGTNGYFEGIRLELADAATPQAATSVQGNTITNISITSSTSSDAMHAINFASGNGAVNIGTVTGNTIGAATGSTGAVSGGITIAASGAVPSHMILLGGTNTISVQNNTIGNILLTAAGSYFSGIFTNTAITGNFSNNTITNITASSTGTTSGRYINGIQVGSGAPVLTIANNTIAGLSCNYLYSGATASQVIGINIASTTANLSGGITGNTIKNLYNASLSTATGTSSAIMGICAASTNTAGATISRNTIDSLVSSAVSGAVNVTGIWYSGTTSITSQVTRNLIHSFTAANTAAILTGMYVNAGSSTFANNMIRLGVNPDGTNLTTALTINGIVSATTSANNFYYNSISVGGGAVDVTASNTYAFRSTAAATHDIRNNIFSNTRSNATTGGTHYALVLSSATTVPGSNYNVYQYTGTGGSFASLDGGTTPIAAYSAGSPWISGDVNSRSGNPQFINATGNIAAVNLHINTAVASVANNGGTPVTAVTTDFDGDARSTTTPDIGADEFATALPVTLLDFYGQKQGASNVLYWTTTNEINNKAFELQHSIDGQSFTTIQVIDSKAVNGNSNSLLSYQATDVQPFAADNYYRLKQVDKNGSFSYSNTILLKGTEPGNITIVSVYPNPVTDQLNVVITANTSGNTSLIIHDMNGRVIVAQTVSLTQGTNRMQLNVSRFATGVYAIKMITADGSTINSNLFVK